MMELRNSVHTSTAINACEPVRLSDLMLELTDRYRYWMFAGVLLIYLAGFNGQWRVERDSALYLTIARNWAEHHGATYRDQPNQLVFPGLPLLLNATFRVFGTGSFFPPVALMLLLGFVTLGLTYRLFLVYAGRPTAVVMTVGLGLTRLYYRYCFEVLTDLPFLLGLMAFLAGYEAIFHGRCDVDRKAGSVRGRWLDWTLLICGLGIAIAMRPVMWVLVAAIILTLAWRAIRGEISWQHIGMGIGVAVAVTVFYLVDVGRHSQGMDDYEATVLHRLKDFHSMLAQVPGNLNELLTQAALVKAVFGCKLFVFLNVGLGVLICILSFTLFRYRILWGFLVICTFGMLVLFQQPLDRYFVAVIPLLVYAWWKFLVWVNHQLPANWGNWLFLALFFGGMGCNIARIGEMIVEQRRRPFLVSYRGGRYESLDRVARLLAENTKAHDWIVAGPDQGRILTLMARRNVVENREKKVLAGHRHPMFALLGPSWAESKDAKHTDRRKREVDWDKNRDATENFLVARGYTLGPAVAGPIEGPRDDEKWLLLQVFPLKPMTGNR